MDTLKWLHGKLWKAGVTMGFIFVIGYILILSMPKEWKDDLRRSIAFGDIDILPDPKIIHAPKAKEPTSADQEITYESFDLYVQYLNIRPGAFIRPNMILSGTMRNDFYEQGTGSFGVYIKGEGNYLVSVGRAYASGVPRGYGYTPWRMQLSGFIPYQGACRLIFRHDDRQGIKTSEIREIEIPVNCLTK